MLLASRCTRTLGVRSFLFILCTHQEMILRMQPKKATSPAPRPLGQKRLQKGGNSMTFSILGRRGCWGHILSFSKSMTSGFLSVCLGPRVPEWPTSSAWQRGRCFPTSLWVPHQKHSSERAVACPHLWHTLCLRSLSSKSHMGSVWVLLDY